MVDGIVAYAFPRLTGWFGDVFAKTERRLERWGLRRVREGTDIGWTGVFFDECPARAYRLPVSPVPARTVLGALCVAGARNIVRRIVRRYRECAAKRFPVIAPNVR